MYVEVVSLPYLDLGSVETFLLQRSQEALIVLRVSSHKAHDPSSCVILKHLGSAWTSTAVLHHA